MSSSQTPRTPQPPTASRPPQADRPSTPRRSQGQSPAPFILLTIKWVLVAIAIILLGISIAPYIFVIRMAAKTVQGDIICGQLGLAPFIGQLLGGGCNFIGSVFYVAGGFLLWWLFQSFELVPIAANFNVPWMAGMLRRMEDAPQLPENQSDRESVARLKERINTVADRSYETLMRCSWLVYAVDLVLMCWLYPPLNKQGDVDVMALLIVIAGVFGVELILLLLTLVNNAIDPASIRFPTARTRPARNYD